MDDQMDELAVFGMAAIICEMIWRTRVCHPQSDTDSWSTILITAISQNSYQPCMVFIISYTICIAVALFDLKHVSFFQSNSVRKMLSFLHAIDPITAATLGIGLYFERMDIIIISVTLSTKLGLLSFVTRMITGKVSKTKIDSLLETTRAYLHHVGSFLFLISNNKITLLTAFWRCFTLLGHALVASKIKSDDPAVLQPYEFKIKIIAYIRQILLVIVLLICFIFPDHRRGFALSAVGHVSYLTVRFSSIVRIGSTYLSKTDRDVWQKQFSDMQKIQALMQGKYPWLAVELGLLLFASVYLIILRFMTTGMVVVGSHSSTSVSSNQCIIV